MPRVADGEGLTPCSTLLWGEKAVGTPKRNGQAEEKRMTLRLQNFYTRVFHLADTIQ